MSWLLKSDEAQTRHRVSERTFQAEEMASATALWQKMAGTKPRGGEMGMDGGADRCGWSREKEGRDLGRVWNNKKGTDSRPHRPLREVAFSWEKSC